MEEGALPTSYIPTAATGGSRAPDDFDEVLTPFPNMSDAIPGITTSHIGHPLAEAEPAAMSQLEVEAPTTLRDWGGGLSGFS